MFKSINKIIKVLTFSDLFLLTGFGFLSPIFAIFITERIQGGNAEVAGFSMAIYLITQSLVQIPFGRYLDRHQGEKDDLLFVMIGFLFASFVAFAYIFVSMPWHIYVLQAIYGLGMAMNIAGWPAIFTRHIDKGREAFEWSTRSTLVGVGAGISGALGGIIITEFGFEILFISIGIFGLIGAFLPILIWNDVISVKRIKSKIKTTKNIPLLPKE